MNISNVVIPTSELIKTYSRERIKTMEWNELEVLVSKIHKELAMENHRSDLLTIWDASQDATKVVV